LVRKVVLYPSLPVFRRAVVDRTGEEDCFVLAEVAGEGLRGFDGGHGP